MRPRGWVLRTFICLMVMGYSTQVFSQRYQFSERSAIKGLPSKETYEIFQARDGFLWIASDEGIIRYDGYEPTIFNATKGLPDPVIFSFYEHADSAIWFRSLSGKTSYYKNGKVTLYPHSKKIEAIAENNYLHSIIRNDDRLYFGAGLSIGYINDQGEVTEEPIAKKTMMIRSISEKSLIYGMMGFSTRAKQIDFDGSIYPIQLSDTLTYNKVIRALKIKSDVFVSINSDIFRISGNICEKFFTGRGPIISLSPIDGGNLWVGYLNAGADQLSILKGRIVKSEIMLDTKSVSSAIRDNEGGLWISTLESGVYYIENPSYQFTPLPYKPTVSIFKNNQLFVGDLSGELTIYRYPELTPTWKMKTNQPTRSLYLDRDENLWVASDRTNVIDLRSKTIKKYFPHSFSSFAEDSTHV